MIDVIFSSFNGERTLPAMLEACCALAAPADGWRLIAVDNGSTDRSAEVIEAFASRLPLHQLHEPQRGKNHALNRGLEVATAALLVLTDDDVLPAPNWLLELERSAALHPAHSIFGGAIMPKWPVEPPAWLLSQAPLGMLYAMTDPAWIDGEVNLCNGEVWGPNMMFRRQIFETGIRFKVDIGPDGTPTYMMGSETELVKRLMRQGHRAWYCPSARVQHLIRPEQLELAWVMQRFFRHGRSSFAIDHSRPINPHQFLGIETWLYRRLVERFMAQLLARFAGDDARNFMAQSEYQRARGMFYQARLDAQFSKFGAKARQARPG